MYMDQNELRTRRERTEGELLHQLLAQGGAEATYPKMTRGCDGRLRTGDHRGGMMPRGEGIMNGAAESIGGCGCHDHDHDHDHGSMDHGEIGNTYPCGENGVEGRALAMVYAPIQQWRNAYDPHTALHRGTLFRELDMPFCGGKKTDRGGNCRGC